MIPKSNKISNLLVMQRIAIIGLPGSGKSTFAIALGKKLNISVHHLDQHQFQGRKKRDKGEFLLIKEALLSEESWIIEGCSLSTLEMRFSRADCVIYFQLPRLLCIWRVCMRYLDRNLAETGCLQGINWTLIKYIWTFNKNYRHAIEELKVRYPNVEFITFKNVRDPDNYLNDLKSPGLV